MVYPLIQQTLPLEGLNSDMEELPQIKILSNTSSDAIKRQMGNTYGVLALIITIPIRVKDF